MTSHPPSNIPYSAPMMLEGGGWPDFELLDSGDGRKLERYGPYRLVRPEEQALWRPALSEAEWEAADAVFLLGQGDDEERGGGWAYSSTISETWPLSYQSVQFLGRFTRFRHVGLFAEQAAHWRWTEEKIKGQTRPISILNLFAYTGVASLVAAAAGAKVTHVDASKKAIGWARENQALSKMEDLAIRWICDDAMKFLAREVRRGNRYDMILLDPPKFGRGPKGETWSLFADLPEAMRLCSTLLSDHAIGLVLTAYSIRASFLSIDGLMREILASRGGQIQSGELVITESSGRRALPTSLFSRWSR